jgi:hypothetical protein
MFLELDYLDLVTLHHHSLLSITWGLIIYKIKINLLLLRAISLMKPHITRGFNTTSGHIENMVCVRV